MDISLPSPMALDVLSIGRESIGFLSPSIADTHPFTPHTTTSLPVLYRDIPRIIDSVTRRSSNRHKSGRSYSYSFSCRKSEYKPFDQGPFLPLTSQDVPDSLLSVYVCTWIFLSTSTMSLIFALFRRHRLL